MDNYRFTDLPPDSVIFGKSAVMFELHGRLKRLCSTNLPILLHGESGAGKALLSRFIHNHASGVVSAYLRVDCASSSRTWPGPDPFASVIGNYRNTSIVGTESSESGPTGTLFLNEVGELSPLLQLKLLHLLQEEEPHEGDGQASTATKPRIVCATTRNLRQEANKGRFRQELFYRLAVVTLEVPPLRNRLDDLLVIANYLRLYYAEKFGLLDNPFPKRLVERMYYYEWPGNIREFESFVCRYVILGSDDRVLLKLSSNNDRAPAYGMIRPGDALLKEVTRRTLAEVEREMIVKALDLHNSNLKKAANSLGISYRTLINKMDQAGLPRVHHATKSGEDLES
jgi:two-component system, NtrC family, response regulator AtoC